MSAGAVTLLALLLVGALNRQTPVTTLPSSMPSGSGRPHPLATSTPTPLEIGVGQLGAVAVVSLGMHDAPRGAPFGVLEEGQLVEVIERTSEAGEHWLLVQSLQGFGPDSRFGWIPAVIGEVSSVMPVDDQSCGEATIGALTALPPNERLTCWRGGELRLEGYLRAHSLDDYVEYSGRRAWLAGPRLHALVTAVGPAVDAVPFFVRFPPGVDVPPLSPADGPGTLVQVRGHFDDPGAATCRRDPTEPELPDLSHDIDVLWCQQQFVVSEASAAE